MQQVYYFMNILSTVVIWLENISGYVKPKIIFKTMNDYSV